VDLAVASIACRCCLRTVSAVVSSLVMRLTWWLGEILMVAIRGRPIAAFSASLMVRWVTSAGSGSGALSSTMVRSRLVITLDCWLVVLGAAAGGGAFFDLAAGGGADLEATEAQVGVGRVGGGGGAVGAVAVVVVVVVMVSRR